MDPAPLVLAGTFAPKLSARLKDLGGGDVPGGGHRSLLFPAPPRLDPGRKRTRQPRPAPTPTPQPARPARPDPDGQAPCGPNPPALPALGQAHPHMGPRDDGAGGADPSRNAAGLAPRCRARSEEQRLAVLKGGERAALPAPPAQRAWSKVTRHAQRHNKGRSPSHPPAAFLARCPGIPQRCSAPPGSGSYTYPVPAAASRGIPVSPHCPPVSPCPPHSSPCPGAPLNPRP